MAVYHCHTHAISRSGKSGSALACAAYRSGEALHEQTDKGAFSAAELAAYRTGEIVADGSGKVHDYTRKGGVAHTEIVLPKGVDAAWASDRAALWNQAEGAEKRINSRVAREWRVALPHELDHGQRVELACDFAETIVERYGVAADMAVHAPSRSGDQRNWHAHILCTTREITDEGFGAKARIEWSNTNCKKAGIPYTSLQIREMRMAWEEHANEHLARAGHENRVDHRSYAEQDVALEAARTVHVGQTYAEERDRVAGTERILPVERLDQEQSARNAEAIEADPGLILDRVAGQYSAFTRRDVASTLHRFVNEDWQQFDRTLETVMASDRLVNLVEGGRQADTGREVEAVWSTREVATREAGMLDRAERLATSGKGGFSERSVDRGIAAVENGTDHGSSPSNGRRIALSEEQREAVRTLARDGQLALLRGVAGSGKTTALSAFREAAEAEGVRVTGAALAGKAARELEEGSGIEARTLASLERSWSAGFDRLERGDVLVVDEAGMVGSAQMARVMERVEEAGAKLVLVGDERQLQPIEAGAAFRNVKERVAETGHGAEAEQSRENSADRGRGTTIDRASARTPVAELASVRRQSSAWQRKASELFGRGEAGAALDAYRERGEVRLHDSTEHTHAAIVSDYFKHRDAARGSERVQESAQEALREPNGRRGAWASLRSAIGLKQGRKSQNAPANEGLPERSAGRESDHIVTAYRNVDVDALNGAIRTERVARGELTEGAFYRTDRGQAEFARGDHVLLTANDRSVGVANGDRGIVLDASEDRLAIRTRDGRDMTIEADSYSSVRHGYAVTTHRAQGMTVDRVHVMAGRGMDAPLAYVAMTRQREGATLHASRDHFRDYATLRESVSRERQAHGIGDYLPSEGSALRAVRERIAATERVRGAESVHKAEPIDERTERLRAAVQERAARSRETTTERTERLREAVRGSGRDAPETDYARAERLRAAVARGQERSAESEDERGARLREALRDGAGASRSSEEHTKNMKARLQSARNDQPSSRSVRGRDRHDEDDRSRTTGRGAGHDHGAER